MFAFVHSLVHSFIPQAFIHWLIYSSFVVVVLCRLEPSAEDYRKAVRVALREKLGVVLGLLMQRKACNVTDQERQMVRARARERERESESESERGRESASG
jgi:hypothetical protein